MAQARRPNEQPCLTFPLRRGPRSFATGRLLGPAVFGRSRKSRARRQIAHRFAAIFARRFTSGFFSTVNGIAEHSRPRRWTPHEMDLKAVGLLLGARFGVDALDVLLGIGIGSFPHNFWPNELRVRSTFGRCKCALRKFKIIHPTGARAQEGPISAPSGHRPRAAVVHSRDDEPLAARLSIFEDPLLPSWCNRSSGA